MTTGRINQVAMFGVVFRKVRFTGLLKVSIKIYISVSASFASFSSLLSEKSDEGTEQKNLIRPSFFRSFPRAKQEPPKKKKKEGKISPPPPFSAGSLLPSEPTRFPFSLSFTREKKKSCIGMFFGYVKCYHDGHHSAHRYRFLQRKMFLSAFTLFRHGA